MEASVKREKAVEKVVEKAPAKSEDDSLPKKKREDKAESKLKDKKAKVVVKDPKNGGLQSKKEKKSKKARAGGDDS